MPTSAAPVTSEPMATSTAPVTLEPMISSAARRSVPVSVDGCAVCGVGKVVSKPNAIFSFPDQPSVSCGLLQQVGADGSIPLEFCSYLPPLIGVCECVPTPSATSAPVTLKPTTSSVAPVTSAPMPTSAAPVTSEPMATSTAPVTLEPMISSAARRSVPVSVDGCAVCGVGKVVSKPNAIFSFPDQPSVSCGLLQQVGADGSIPLAFCSYLPPLIGVCECVATPTATSAPTFKLITSSDAPVTSEPVSITAIPLENCDNSMRRPLLISFSDTCDVVCQLETMKKANIYKTKFDQTSLGIIILNEVTDEQLAILRGESETIVAIECDSDISISTPSAITELTTIAPVTSEPMMTLDAPVTSIPLTRAAPVFAEAPVMKAPSRIISAPLPADDGCSICGVGEEVSKPDLIFSFPGQPGVSCGLLQSAGIDGSIPMIYCGRLAPIIGNVCGCAPITTTTMEEDARTTLVKSDDTPVTSAPPVTSSPVTLAPLTTGPVTLAPINS